MCNFDLVMVNDKKMTLPIMISCTSLHTAIRPEWVRDAISEANHSSDPRKACYRFKGIVGLHLLPKHCPLM